MFLANPFPAILMSTVMVHSDVDSDGSDVEEDNTLMQKSQQIMTQIQEFMIENKRDHTTEQEIITLCNEVRKALVLWDDVFSKANKEYESTTVDWVTKHCDDTQKSIEQAMFQMRLMGFSITPKMHGLECHLVHLMRTIPGGIHQMIEHWVEQYHQKAAEMERMWTGHSHEEQAGFCVRRENMLSKKGTMDAGVRVIDSLRKQKRKRTETTLAEEERIREARRLIKQEVQEKMDNEAGEGSIDIDGNDGTIGTL